MAYGRSQSSIWDTFSLSPLPYPVLLILLLVLLLMAVSWSFTYEDMIESAEAEMSWALLATPVILILLVSWLSTVESFDGSMFGWGGYNGTGARRPQQANSGPQEGSSPWGVAAVVILLLVMISFQSTFRDMWRP